MHLSAGMREGDGLCLSCRQIFLNVIPDVLKCTLCSSFLTVPTCILWGKAVSVGTTVNQECMFLDNNLKAKSTIVERLMESNSHGSKVKNLGGNMKLFQH